MALEFPALHAWVVSYYTGMHTFFFFYTRESRKMREARASIHVYQHVYREGCAWGSVMSERVIFAMLASLSAGKTKKSLKKIGEVAAVRIELCPKIVDD